MIEYARKLRGPATVGVLVIICFYVAVAVVYFVALLGNGIYIATAARQAGSDSVSLVWIFVTVALVLTCLLTKPPVANVGRLIEASAIVVSVATGAALVFWIIGLFGDFSLGAWLAALGGMVETLVKAAAAVVLWRLRGWPVESSSDEAEQQAVAEPESGQAPGRPPVWNPPEAVGLQWNRAGDAAAGAVPPSLTGEAAVTPDSPAVQPPAAPRQLWSRGGIPPEALPAAPDQTAAEAEPAKPPSTPKQPPTAPGQRPAPDWSPAPRPE